MALTSSEGVSRVLDMDTYPNAWQVVTDPRGGYRLVNDTMFSGGQMTLADAEAHKLLMDRLDHAYNEVIHLREEYEDTVDREATDLLIAADEAMEAVYDKLGATYEDWDSLEALDAESRS